MLFLVPLSWLFCLIVLLRRKLYRSGFLKSVRFPVTVIIAGNITVGGSGKTPLVIALANWLVEQGYRPGIVSRGYGGVASTWPQQVRHDSDPKVVGDEPVLIARHSNVPMAVGPDRVAATQQLLEHHNCDVIIADDGLQHYALQRDIEIAVIDGVRRLGNGYCLPAGPLREKEKRLQEVDFIVTNGLAMHKEFAMTLKATEFINLQTGQVIPLHTFRNQTCHAVAGIGHPQRFFQYLQSLGINVRTHEYSDHHRYRAEDIRFEDELPVLMTEKDAVKCKAFATSKVWYAPVEAQLDPGFFENLKSRLNQIDKSHKHPS